MTRSILHLSLVLFAFVSTILCSSRASNHSKRRGISSSSSNDRVVTIEMTVDLSRPTIQSNGRYSDLVVHHAASIFRTNLERYAVSNYETCPFFETIFGSACGYILIEMALDLETVLQTIIHILAQEYADKARKYCREGTTVDLESQKFQNFTRTVVVFVQETYSNDLKLPKEHSLIFLEFIYRFATAGTRYGLAFQGLYIELAATEYSLFYDIAVDYFIPERVALPILFVSIKNEESLAVKRIFKDFLLNLYSKITELDPVRQGELYTRHASMLISSMMSCNFFEEFSSNLFEMLENVDLHKLLPSPRIVFAIKTICHQCESEEVKPAIVSFIATLLVQDSFILSLDASNYLNYGALIHYLDTADLFDKLSIEAKERFSEIQCKYSNYKMIIDNAQTTFSNLNQVFLGMEMFDLEDLCGLISQIISISDEFFVHQQNEASLFTVSLLRTIPAIIKNVSLNPAPIDLSVKRFKTILRMVQLGMTGPAVLTQITDVVALVLLYFNLNIAKFTAVRPEILTECDFLIDLLFKMTKGNKFFQQDKHQTLLFNFLQLAKPIDEAEHLMKLLLLENIRVISNKLAAISEVIEITKNLKIHQKEIVIGFINAEIEKYLRNSPNVPLDTFQHGELNLILKAMVGLDILSKTENEMIKAFSNRFSSTPIFT